MPKTKISTNSICAVVSVQLNTCFMFRTSHQQLNLKKLRLLVIDELFLLLN